MHNDLITDKLPAYQQYLKKSDRKFNDLRFSDSNSNKI